MEGLIMRYLLRSLAVASVLGLAFMSVGATTAKADPYWHHYHRGYYPANAYYGGYYPGNYGYASPGYYAAPAYGYGYAYPGYGYGYAGPTVGIGYYGGGHYYHHYRNWR
jgi:hypothetical protein